MIDQDVRDFLERMAAEEPVPFLNPEPLARRARRRAARTVVVGAIGVAAALALVFAGASQLREASPRVPANSPAEPPVDLGIFKPVAGRIVYYTDSSLWAVDPNAPSPVSTLVRLSPGGTANADQFASFTLPLGWSRDGTKLLFLREDPTDETFPYDRYLYILHADGTETQVIPEPVSAAAISPDGSRVVYSSRLLKGVVRRRRRRRRTGSDRQGGGFTDLLARREADRVPRLAEGWMLRRDGARTRVGGERGRHRRARDPGGRAGLGQGRVRTHVVAGGRPHRDGELLGRHVAIYTFAPDGSGFTKVIDEGINPFWSPDGSQIAYMRPYGDTSTGAPLAIADADGSNVQVFDFGGIGPWHPGTPTT